MRSTPAAFVVYSLFTFTLAARAADAFSLQTFRPAIDSKGFVTVNASRVLGHLDFSLGLVGTYMREPMPPVTDVITPQLQVALGLLRWFELGLSLPVHILFGRQSGATFGAQHVGDLGLHAKVRLLPARHKIGLALLTSVYAPTSPRADLFLGEGQTTLRPELILDGELGRVRLALNLGALIRPEKHRYADRELGTQLTYGLALSGAIVKQKFDLVFELTGHADVTGSANAHPLEASAAAKVYLASKSYFLVGAGASLIPHQTGGPLARAFIGFIFEPHIGDRDEDGVKDDVDRCPDDPEDLDDFEDADGCPDWDNDRDGIPDRLDKCPNQPETKNGFQDDDGCPDVVEPEPVDDPDRDTDGDGIRDRDDLCPLEPEIINGFEDQDGCPDKGLARTRRGRVEIFDSIHFETASATIKPESFPTLDAVAATLVGTPQIRLLEIQGHADERGDDDYNLQLTEARAHSVKQYLIAHGVAPDRLQSHGYGETRPVCRAHTAACWTKNRRVELIILLQDGPIPGQD
jgi:outer membrane protein OmpA-like peptidoglycan-associated protein